MKKKRPLTLLEVMFATVLLGFVLTGLFQAFRQGLEKNIAARKLKQKVLQIELFQQKMRNLFASEEGVWIEKHPDSSSPALFIDHEVLVDPDFTLCGKLQGMLFLNTQKELCFVSWSDTGSSRIETLLDQVEEFKCRLFDVKTASWECTWPQKKGEEPAMVCIDLKLGEKEIPFVFFLKKGNEPLIYTGP